MQLRLRAKSPISFGLYRKFEAANVIRGHFGRELFEGWPDVYTRLFAPPEGGPSGLKDPPRPYVVRARELNGRSFEASEEIPFRVHLFEGDWPECERVVLDLRPRLSDVTRVRVEFLSPTKLRSSTDFAFGPLFARLRDRVSGLRGLYGPGPLEIDFRGMGERALVVKTLRSELEEVRQSRFSRSTGQRHSIGGFVGVVEYGGELAEFLPYLEAGYWTGVGRHTAWGNGEIRATPLG